MNPRPNDIHPQPFGDSLTPLRGVAAFCVLLFHAVGELPVLIRELGIWARLLEKCYLWVDFFFILSGYVIALAYAARLRHATVSGKFAFLLLRLGRIYPVHLVSLAGLVFLEILVGVIGRSDESPFTLKSRSIESIFSNLLLVHSVGIHDNFTWNIPAWSISCEWVAYLLFVFWAGAVAGISVRIAKIGLAMCFCGYLVMYSVRGSLDYTTDYGLLRCHLGFVAGALLNRIISNYATTDASSSHVYAAALLMVPLGFILTAWLDADWILIPVFFMLCFIMARPTAPLRSFTLETAIFQGLGKMSYSVYMTHWLAISSVPAVFVRILGINAREGGGTLFQNMLVVTCIFVLTFILSILCHRYVEEPGRIFARQIVRRFKF